MVVHVDEDEHLPEWMQSKVIHKGLNKQKRKRKEPAYTTIEENVNTALCSSKLSKVAATITQVKDFRSY